MDRLFLEDFSLNYLQTKAGIFWSVSQSVVFPVPYFIVVRTLRELLVTL